MGAWNVIKDENGKVVSHGFCDFQQKHLAPGWTIESYDSPQQSIIDSKKPDDEAKENDKKGVIASAKGKLKALGLTEAELKAIGL